MRNVPKNGTTLHVGISNARLTASQYCAVFSFELNASVRNLKPGISSVMVNHNGRNASILNIDVYSMKLIEFPRSSWQPAFLFSIEDLEYAFLKIRLNAVAEKVRLLRQK